MPMQTDLVAHRIYSTGPAYYSSRGQRHCEGNSDFYGLGIRLGIYLQWITTLLAHLFFDESIPGNLELNCVFLVAVSAGTLVATRAGTIRPAECLVLLHLCFGFIFSILSIWGHRIDMKFSLAGSSFRLALATAISAYAVWFWFRGRELFVQDACQTFTIIVVPKVFLDPIGTFYKAQSSVVLAVYGFLLARELLTTFCFFVLCAIASVHDFSENDQNSQQDQERCKQSFNVFAISGIYDIATTGQLIPFIIGIVSILRFFLALTVQSTTQYVTNILLQLFDKEPRVDSVEDGTVGEARVVNRDFVYPISPRHEAVFWNRIRPRRHSMGTDPKLSEDRPDKVRYQQIFHYDRYLAEHYSNPGSELSSDDDDISDLD
ncbi:hypothetical protein LA080_002950 [Diaporthe eres]|nr:hypothetical protein LA080_002950 [Diaporthe eres]